MDAGHVIHFARVDFRNDGPSSASRTKTAFRTSTSLARPAPASRRSSSTSRLSGLAWKRRWVICILILVNTHISCGRTQQTCTINSKHVSVRLLEMVLRSAIRSMLRYAACSHAVTNPAARQRRLSRTACKPSASTATAPGFHPAAKSASSWCCYDNVQCTSRYRGATPAVAHLVKPPGSALFFLILPGRELNLRLL
jgi:hypothetical protein